MNALDTFLSEHIDLLDDDPYLVRVDDSNEYEGCVEIPCGLMEEYSTPMDRMTETCDSVYTDEQMWQIFQRDRSFGYA